MDRIAKPQLDRSLLYREMDEALLNDYKFFDGGKQQRLCQTQATQHTGGASPVHVDVKQCRGTAVVIAQHPELPGNNQGQETITNGVQPFASTPGSTCACAACR